MNDQQPVALNIKMTPAGLELAIAALRKLPHETVHELVQDLFTQGQAEFKRVQDEAAAAPQEAPTVEPVKAVETTE